MKWIVGANSLDDLCDGKFAIINKYDGDVMCDDDVLYGAAYWGSFYRNNPDKFVEQYFHIKPKPFQRIVIRMMFWASTLKLFHRYDDKYRKYN